jgi:CheY-like chemotaxis protein
LDLSIFPVEPVCRASLFFFERMARKKRIEISFSCGDNVTTMQADQRRLKQILINLLSNAVKFTPPGGQVGLAVELDEGGEIICFTVWDTGIGIAEEDATKLFQPFVQLDSSLARQYEGTGLGLEMVSQLAQLHGGGVSLVSQVGQGSRFTVSLPRSVVAQILPPANERSQPPGVGPVAVKTVEPQPEALVLLAEDKEANLILVRDFLQSRGYRVIVARDGAKAIEQAGAERPDIILMDVRLPGMTGLEATRRLRDNPALASVPIIALTALAMPGDKERCLEAGMSDYLSKPIRLEELARVLETHLRVEMPGK